MASSLLARNIPTENFQKDQKKVFKNFSKCMNGRVRFNIPPDMHTRRTVGIVNDPITVYHGISRSPPGFYLIHTQFIYDIKLRYTRPTNCRDLGGPPIVPRLSGILQTDSAALFKIGAKKN